MATAKLYSSTGEQKGTVELSAAVFEQPVHRQALYEAVRNYLANQRQGTHDTKTRAEVVGSKQKMFRQKGTGRARMGSITSPSRVGGGRAHGPHPRDYSYTLPRKVKRLALKSALSDRAAAERINVVEDFQLDAPPRPRPWPSCWARWRWPGVTPWSCCPRTPRPTCSSRACGTSTACGCCAATS